MKSVIAKLLVVFTLFSFTPLKELMKMPLLVIHYVEHIKELPEMTFSEFYEMHYLHGIVFDEDYEKDMQLPFKMIDYTPLPYFVLNDLKVIEYSEKSNTFILKSKLNSSFLFFIPDAILSGIFHPPRVA